MNRVEHLAVSAMVTLAAVVMVLPLTLATSNPVRGGSPHDSAGHIVFTSDRKAPAEGSLNVYRVAADGRGPTKKLTDAAGNNVMPAWSPDGTEIAFVHYDATGTYDLWRMEADGSGETPLTSDLMLNVDPVWYPRDQKIAFVNGAGDIYSMALNSSGEPAGDLTRLTTNSATDRQPVVSPDGTRIAFASDRDGDFDIYVMKTARESTSNVPLKLTRDTVSELAPAWSPDSARIAFARGQEGDREIFFMKDVPQSRSNRPTNLSENADADDTDPAWSPEGGSIAFSSDRTGDYEIWRTSVDRTETINVTDSPISQEGQPDWYPLP